MLVNNLLQSASRRAASGPAVPKGTQFPSLDPATCGPHVPVYSMRDPLHRELIAHALAGGQVAAFYLGLFTIVRALRPPRDGGDGGELFWQVKPNRPRWSKLPVIVRPEDALPLIDFDEVHPHFRHLALPERFARLWQTHGAPLHIIAPLRQPMLDLHPAFQTLPEGLRRQATIAPRAVDRLLDRATASFFWMADPAWDDLAIRFRHLSPPRTFLGGTSFNDHGQQPPYTYDELVAHVRARGTIDFDLVITDPLFERAGVFSSHTMVRLPLAGEPPELAVTRHGSLTPAQLAARTGYRVRVLGSVAAASRQPGLSDQELTTRLCCFRAERDHPRADALETAQPGALQTVGHEPRMHSSWS